MSIQELLNSYPATGKSSAQIQWLSNFFANREVLDALQIRRGGQSQHLLQETLSVVAASLHRYEAFEEEALEAMRTGWREGVSVSGSLQDFEVETPQQLIDEQRPASEAERIAHEAKLDQEDAANRHPGE